MTPKTAIISKAWDLFIDTLLSTGITAVEAKRVADAAFNLCAISAGNEPVVKSVASFSGIITKASLFETIGAALKPDEIFTGGGYENYLSIPKPAA